MVELGVGLIAVVVGACEWSASLGMRAVAMRQPAWNAL